MPAFQVQILREKGWEPTFWGHPDRRVLSRIGKAADVRLAVEQAKAGIRDARAACPYKRYAIVRVVRG